jgi:hypothetical protein
MRDFMSVARQTLEIGIGDVGGAGLNLVYFYCI